MSLLKQSIGARARALREKMQLSLAEVGQTLANVQDIEEGNDVSMRSLQQLALVLGVDVSELFELPPHHEQASGRVDAYLRTAQLDDDDKKWLASAKTLTWFGQSPSVDELVKANRTRNAHALDAQLRVVLIDSAFDTCARLDDVIVVSNQGEQDLALRLAYQLARS